MSFNLFTPIVTKALLASTAVFALTAVGLSVALYVTGLKLDVEKEKVNNLTETVIRLNTEMMGASAATTKWELLLNKANDRITEMVQAETQLIEKNKEKVRAEHANRVKAEQTLSIWQLRYASLSQNNECSVLLNTPVCAELQENTNE